MKSREYRRQDGKKEKRGEGTRKERRKRIGGKGREGGWQKVAPTGYRGIDVPGRCHSKYIQLLGQTSTDCRSSCLK
jgi:hypothetical protein